MMLWRGSPTDSGLTVPGQLRPNPTAAGRSAMSSRPTLIQTSTPKPSILPFDLAEGTSLVL